jgi:hypothetical protein
MKSKDNVKSLELDWLTSERMAEPDQKFEYADDWLHLQINQRL